MKSTSPDWGAACAAAAAARRERYGQGRVQRGLPEALWLTSTAQNCHGSLINDGFGLEPFDVDADGNCQFSALAHQLFADEAHHAAVRQTVCGQLCEFADRYRDFVEGYEAFVDALTRIEWGNHVTLHAAADATTRE